jgi:hypothetical protein
VARRCVEQARARPAPPAARPANSLRGTAAARRDVPRRGGDGGPYGIPEPERERPYPKSARHHNQVAIECRML